MWAKLKEASVCMMLWRTFNPSLWVWSLIWRDRKHALHTLGLTGRQLTRRLHLLVTQIFEGHSMRTFRRMAKWRQTSQLRRQESREFKVMIQRVIKRTRTHNSPKVLTQMRTLNGVWTPKQMSTICKTGLHSALNSITHYLCISASVSNGFTICTWPSKVEFSVTIWVLGRLSRSPLSWKAYSTLRR